MLTKQELQITFFVLSVKHCGMCVCVFTGYVAHVSNSKMSSVLPNMRVPATLDSDTKLCPQ